MEALFKGDRMAEMLKRDLFKKVCCCYPIGHHKYPCPNHPVDDSNIEGFKTTLKGINAWWETSKTRKASIEFAFNEQVKVVLKKEKRQKPLKRRTMEIPPIPITTLQHWIKAFDDGTLEDEHATQITDLFKREITEIRAKAIKPDQLDHLKGEESTIDTMLQSSKLSLAFPEVFNELYEVWSKYDLSGKLHKP